MPKTNAAVAIAYIRVSTDEQTLSPHAQRSSIEAFAKREGITVAAWFSDTDICGETELAERPGLIEAMAALKAHRAGVLLVAKRDRLARDVLVTAMVEKACAKIGARVVSAAGEGNGNDPGARLHRGIVDLFSEYELAMIRARTKAALAVKRAKGEFTGGQAPYGFVSIGGKLVPQAEEQRVIARMRDLSECGLSTRDIAARLERDGVQSRTGRPFGKSQVARILKAQPVASERRAA
jgi:DNA invertase Pin-like site-specific DNA recombinase